MFFNPIPDFATERRQECAQLGNEEFEPVLKRFMHDAKEVVKDSCKVALDILEYEEQRYPVCGVNYLWRVWRLFIFGLHLILGFFACNLTYQIRGFHEQALKILHL
jgi:hypothetical protein